MNAYRNLCTEFYDLLNPHAGSAEIAYYENLLKTFSGPILEGMCGSGRLLIPLLQKGYQIDGVDNSTPMLQSCQKRCKEQNLEVKLYCQSLQTLSLPQKYDLIFIAIGSFQLIQAKHEALQILKNLRAALNPQGTLALEIFIPDSKAICFERSVYTSDGCEIICKSKPLIDLEEQLEITQIQYEKWKEGHIIETAEEEHAIRWYHPPEMQLLLEQAGFTSHQLDRRHLTVTKEGVVYLASFK